MVLKAKLDERDFEMVSHSTYCLDLIKSNYYLLAPLKKDIPGFRNGVTSNLLFRSDQKQLLSAWTSKKEYPGKRSHCGN